MKRCRKLSRNFEKKSLISTTIIIDEIMVKMVNDIFINPLFSDSNKFTKKSKVSFNTFAYVFQ